MDDFTKKVIASQIKHNFLFFVIYSDPPANRPVGSLLSNMQSLAHTRHVQVGSLCGSVEARRYESYAPLDGFRWLQEGKVEKEL